MVIVMCLNKGMLKLLKKLGYDEYDIEELNYEIIEMNDDNEERFEEIAVECCSEECDGLGFGAFIYMKELLESCNIYKVGKKY